MGGITGVAHLVVRVSDWKRSASWYQDVLGFVCHRGDGFSVFRHPGAAFGILLRPTDAALSPSDTPGERLDHLALHVPTVEALEAWRSHLAATGIDEAIEHQPGIGSSLTIHDPDGLEIELFTPAAGSLLAVDVPKDSLP